jgi:hypothetical protein
MLSSVGNLWLAVVGDLGDTEVSEDRLQFARHHIVPEQLMTQVVVESFLVNGFVLRHHLDVEDGREWFSISFD